MGALARTTLDRAHARRPAVDASTVEIGLRGTGHEKQNAGAGVAWSGGGWWKGRSFDTRK
jgi:hypothetical protein